MSRVLVIEDDGDTRVLVGTALRRAGYSVLMASSGGSGLEIVRGAGVDLVILDLGLPGLSGEDVLTAMQSDPTTRSVPVIIVSGRSAEADRVHGLELGAEDYVTKPFSLRELLLRVRIALRRHASTPPPEWISAGALTIDFSAHRVLMRGVELALTPTEFRLVATLASRIGQAQSRQSLLVDVWGMQPDLETRTVDTHVNRLREKLGTSAASCGVKIETVRGVGYRLIEVSAVAAPESVAS